MERELVVVPVTRNHPLEKCLTALHEASAKPGRIRVLFDHAGGDVRVGFRMYEYLRALGERVTGVAVGEVASSAAIAFMGCRERLALRSAGIRFHYPARYNSLKIFLDKELFEKNRLSAYEIINRIDGIVTQATAGKLEGRALRKLMDEDRNLGPQEAIRLGLVQREVEKL